MAWRDAKPASSNDKKPYKAQTSKAARDDKHGADRDARKWIAVKQATKGKRK